MDKYSQSEGLQGFFEQMGVPEHEENAIDRSLTPEIINKVLTTAADYDMIIRA